MLIEFDLGLYVLHLHLKRHNGIQHGLRISFWQASPLLGIRWLMVGNELFQDGVLGLFTFQNSDLCLDMNSHIAPGRHSDQIGVYRGRHVGLWSHECQKHGGSVAQKTGMRIAFGNMAQQCVLLGIACMRN